jgi:hypothetical protein
MLSASDRAHPTATRIGTDRIAPGHQRRLVAKRQVAVLDLPDAALHVVSAVAESAGLPVEDPFAGKVGLFLSEP